MFIFSFRHFLRVAVIFFAQLGFVSSSFANHNLIKTNFEDRNPFEFWKLYNPHGNIALSISEPGFGSQRAIQLKIRGFDDENSGLVSFGLVPHFTNGYSGARAIKPDGLRRYKLRFFVRGDLTSLKIQILGWRDESAGATSRTYLNSNLGEDIEISKYWRKVETEFFVGEEIHRISPIIRFVGNRTSAAIGSYVQIDDLEFYLVEESTFVSLASKISNFFGVELVNFLLVMLLSFSLLTLWLVSINPKIPIPKVIPVLGVMVAVIELALSFGLDLSDNYLSNRRFYSPTKAPSIEESIVQWQVFGAMSDIVPAEVVVIGDCSAALGVNSLMMEEITGLQTRNIGTMGVFGTIGSAENFGLYLEKIGRPKYLIFNMSLAMLTRLRDERWLERLRSWVRPLKSKPDQLSSYLIRNNVQNLLYNFSYSDYPDAFLSKNFRTSYPLNDYKIRDVLTRGRGYLKRIEYNSSFQEAIKIEEEFQKQAEAGIRSALELARKNDIKVLLTIFPMPKISITEETELTTKKVMNALSRISSEFKNTELFKNRYYDDKEFSSLYHLTESGADRYTEEISEWIKNQPKIEPQ